MTGFGGQICHTIQKKLKIITPDDLPVILRDRIAAKLLKKATRFKILPFFPVQ